MYSATAQPSRFPLRWLRVRARPICRVTTFPGAGDTTLTGLKFHGAATAGGAERFVLAGSDRTKAQDLAQLEDVLAVEAVPELKLLNDVARGIMKVGPGTYTPWAAGLTGAGQIVAVMDSGLDTGNSATLHPALRARFLKGYGLGGRGSTVWSDPLGHGTHVSGSVLGDGSFKGVAPGARLIMQSVLTPNGGIYFPNWDYTVPLNAAYLDGARVHTNSWGGALPPGSSYDSVAEDLDQVTFARRDLTVLFAAGNDGSGGIETPGVAKNAITVGASESDRPDIDPVNADNPNEIAYFSSLGPTPDGRVKPDVVAPGTRIVSTGSTLVFGPNQYAIMSGTSMATPLTAGAATLVRQYYISKKAVARPSSALVKATLINGAEDMGYGWGSPEQGWGRVNLQNSLTPVGRTNWFRDEGVPLKTDGLHGYEFSLSEGAILKVTLTWTDYPGSPIAFDQLVNDLDLMVRDPDGNWYTGNCFINGNTVSGNLDVCNVRDGTNNVENVYIQAPKTGKYQVFVQGWDVRSDGQPYALVVSGKDLSYLPDAQAPVISVEGLQSNGYVQGIVNVTASANDNLAVDRMELYLDSQLKTTADGTMLTWTWDTTRVSGNHTVLVKAYDVTGLVTTSTYSVTVDNQGPAISSIAPSNGAALAGTKTVTVAATDNVAIDRAEFYLDDGPAPAATDTAAPYQWPWNTTTASNGAHTVRVRVLDKAGYSAEQELAYTVDNEAPVIAITAPANGVSLPAGPHTVKVTASDNRSVTKVEYLVDGVKKGEGAADNNWAWQWNTAGLTSKAYRLSAKAYDAAGNVTTSATANVTLDTGLPTLTWGSPRTGSFVKGDAVSVSVTAGDTLGLDRVEFWLDNGTDPAFTASQPPFSWSWNTTTVADGPHTLRARAYDKAGNLKEVSAIVTVDNTAPSLSLNDVTDGVRMSNGLVVTAGATDNLGVAKVEFFVDNLMKVADTTSPYTYTLTSITNGPHTFKVRVTDLAGTVVETQAFSILVESIRPSGVVVTGISAGAIVKGDVQLQVSALDNADTVRMEFWLDGQRQDAKFVEVPPAGPAMLAVTTAKTYTFDTTAVSDGAHQLQVKVFDTYSNSASSSAISFKVDNLAAALTGITPQRSAYMGTVTISPVVLDAVGIKRVEFEVVGSNLTKVIDSAAPYAYSLNTTLLPAGNATLRVTVVDLQDRATVNDYVLKIDNQKPVVIISSPTANQLFPIQPVAVTVDGSDNDGIAKVELWVDGKLKLTTTDQPYTFNWSTAGLVSGIHSLVAKAYDGAGNVASSAAVSITVDAAKPTANITAPALNAVVKGASVPVTATASDTYGVTKVEFYLDDALQSTDTASPYAWTWDTTSSSDGAHKLTIKAYDTTGNVTSLDRNVNVDNTAPTVDFANLTAGAYVKPGFVVRIQPSDAVGIAKAEYYVNGTRVYTATTAPYSWTLPSTTTAGAKSLKVVVTDRAGQTGQAEITVTVDRTLPVVSSVVFSPSSMTFTGTVDITVNATDNGEVAQVEFYIGTAKLQTVSGSPATWSFDTTQVTNGSKSLKIMVYDAAGNVVTKTYTVTIRNLAS